MRYNYGQYDGQEFPTPESLFAYDQIFDFILAYGDQALEAMRQLQDADAEILEKLLQDGLLEKAAGRFRLTPRALTLMQRRALMEIFAQLPRGDREGHPTVHAGAGSERLEGTRPYQFGDPVSELDLLASLRQALARHQRRWPTGFTNPL